MNFTKNIYIFSDKIGIGKTTTLLNWAKNQRDIGGILSPKIAGKRYFLDLASLQIRAMESKTGTLKVGQFTFDENAFKWARYEILQQFHSDKRGIIIDEIGPLELKNNEGFHPIITKIFEENAQGKPDFIFVVRDFLVEQFIEKYELTDAKIVPKSFFKNEEISYLNGLVLCGGQSDRMQTDKAFIKYSNEEQWKKNQRTLSPFCREVLLSVNEEQAENWNENERENLLIDDQQMKHLGPLNGILLATKQQPDRSLMISAIDYPLLRTEHFIELNNARSTQSDGVFYSNNGTIEPLIGVLETKAFPQLWDFVENGGKSFRKFLEQINITKIEVDQPNFLTNINTLEEYNEFIGGEND